MGQTAAEVLMLIGERGRWPYSQNAAVTKAAINTTTPAAMRASRNLGICANPCSG
jgi:hypothetical protein